MDIGLLDGVSDTSNKRRRLAIVSTFDELCGIASYTSHLLPQLKEDFDIEVIDLDQYLLRHVNKRVQVLAEKHIDEISRRLKSFDCVNIQLEHGTLGTRPKDIFRRFCKLAEAAPELSVTFHTVMTSSVFRWELFFQHVFTGRWNKASSLVKTHRRAEALATPLYMALNRLSRRKPVHSIVHSKREMRLLKHVYCMDNVHSHPLSFLSSEQANKVRSETQRAYFSGLTHLPADAKLIGTFGFLSPYKGFETVIRSLNYLPHDYHMLIFGGIHPQTIKKGSEIDPYVKQLLEQANIGRTLLDEIANVTASKVNVTLDFGTDASLATSHPKDLSGRIHFMGVLSDNDFARAMAVCDAVVVPYVEVGQSASGPISLALDMGCRVIASRTSTFLQLSRFHPHAIEFFDVGNFIELAQRIVSPPSHDPQQRKLSYTTATNAATYRLANNADAREMVSAAAVA